MKVLLLKDVYKLGHAGDVKKVADGYARNYLIPQGLVTMATPGAIKQADQIKQKADAIRSQLNTEMSSLFEKIDGMVITFASKAGETGKLYGSITPQMIVDAINEKSGASIEKRQLEVEPIRTLGEQRGIYRKISALPGKKCENPAASYTFVRRLQMLGSRSNAVFHVIKGFGCKIQARDFQR